MSLNAHSFQELKLQCEMNDKFLENEMEEEEEEEEDEVKHKKERR